MNEQQQREARERLEAVWSSENWSLVIRDLRRALDALDRVRALAAEHERARVVGWRDLTAALDGPQEREEHQ